MIVIDWIDRFQTLIAGLLALFAAAITVLVLNHQIRQSERHHQEHLSRKFDAARAVLPLVLSRLCDYAKNSLLYAANGRGVISEESEITEETPTLPDDVIPLLKDIVEYADDKISKSTRDLISEIQFHHDRLTSLPKTSTSPQLSGGTLISNLSAFNLAISDAVHLHVHASNFFDYARYRENEPPSLPTNDQVKERLFFFGIEESKFPEVYRRV